MSCDSSCSVQTSPLMDGGGKKKRPLNAWMQLVIRMKKENPDKDLKEVILMAKPIYKKMKASGEVPPPKSAEVKKTAPKKAKKAAPKKAKKAAPKKAKKAAPKKAKKAASKK